MTPDVKAKVLSAAAAMRAGARHPAGQARTPAGAANTPPRQQPAG
jgi:hypothetical protein